MHKAIYIALSGALMKQMELEVISENIANADTPGFKGTGLSFKDYLINNDPDDTRTMTYINDNKLQFLQGPLRRTGNQFDVAIDGKGFLSLEGGLYTRRGDMKRDSDGYLLSSSGRRVLGSNGPVRVPEGDIQIGEDGTLYLNGIAVDKLRIVEFNSIEGLRKVGEGLYEARAQEVTSSSRILQGYLENSSVEIIKEMVKLITSIREFETFQKAIQTLDEGAQKINNEMGRI